MTKQQLEALKRLGTLIWGHKNFNKLLTTNPTTEELYIYITLGTVAYSYSASYCLKLAELLGDPNSTSEIKHQTLKQYREHLKHIEDLERSIGGSP